MAWSWNRLIVVCSSTAAGLIFVNRPGNVSRRASTTANDVPSCSRISSKHRSACPRHRGKHAKHQVLQQVVEELPHERRKGLLRELIVKGLVPHRPVGQGIEAPQDVGERLGAVARQAGQQGDGHPVGSDFPQPVCEPGRPAQACDRVLPKNLGEPARELGKLASVYWGPPLLEWSSQRQF